MRVAHPRHSRTRISYDAPHHIALLPSWVCCTAPYSPTVIMGISPHCLNTMPNNHDGNMGIMLHRTMICCTAQRPCWRCGYVAPHHIGYVAPHHCVSHYEIGLHNAREGAKAIRRYPNLQTPLPPVPGAPQSSSFCKTRSLKFFFAKIVRVVRV